MVDWVGYGWQHIQYLTKYPCSILPKQAFCQQLHDLEIITFSRSVNVKAVTPDVKLNLQQYSALCHHLIDSYPYSLPT